MRDVEIRLFGMGLNSRSTLENYYYLPHHLFDSYVIHDTLLPYQHSYTRSARHFLGHLASVRSPVMVYF